MPGVPNAGGSASAGSSYLCRHCSRRYPDAKENQTCPVHGTPTVFQAAIPADEVDDTISVLRVRVSERDGRHWISSGDVIAAGVHRRLADDEVVQIPRSTPPAKDHPGDDLWEIVSYVEPLRAYWLLPLRVPDYPPSS